MSDGEEHWYMTHYTYGDWLDGIDSDEPDFTYELRGRFRHGWWMFAHDPVPLRDLHEHLDMVETDIWWLMHTLDHVTSEETMSGAYDKDVAFLQGVRHAMKCRMHLLPVM